MKMKLSLFKRRATTLAIALFGWGLLYSQPIDFQMGYDDPYTSQPGTGKGPVTIPSVDLEGYELTFLSSHDDYTLELLQGGVVVYSTFVSSSTNTVILPSTLQGEYEIRLYGDESYYLTGYIVL